MRSTHLSTGLVVALAALLATGAMAQEGKGGGKGGGKGNGGQTADRDGKGRVGTTSTPVATTPPPSTPTGFGGRGNAYTPGIDRNQAEQAAKIEWGQRRGLITDKEAKALKVEQDRIAELERRYKADGHVTRDERRDLRGAQREADRHIRDEALDREREGRKNGRHADRDSRGWGGGWGRGWW